MRLTEYIDFITRTDLKLGRNPKNDDYTHFTPWNMHKSSSGTSSQFLNSLIVQAPFPLIYIDTSIFDVYAYSTV